MQKGIDYIGVGVGGVILNSEGKVFLAKRGRDARNERGKWEFPGGAVEFGEPLRDAVIREVREEYGFEIAVERLLDVVDHILPGEGQHWVSPTCLCRYVRGLPRILEPNKCDEIGWFAVDEVPSERLSAASRDSLANLLRHFAGEEGRRA